MHFGKMDLHLDHEQSRWKPFLHLFLDDGQACLTKDVMPDSSGSLATKGRVYEYWEQVVDSV
jgi:hypothetical protein